MKKSKELIEQVIEGKEKIQFSVRSIACGAEDWSSFIPFVKESEKLLYNSHLIDGVKFRLSNFTLKLNKRHNFK